MVTIASFALISILLITSGVSQKQQTYSKSPNIVLFVIDDILYTKTLAEKIGAPSRDTYHQYLGYCNKSRLNVTYLDIPMPNLEAFMDESLIIPRSYSNPKCAPSRYSLLTGRQIIKCDRGNSRAEGLAIRNDSTYGTIGMTVQVETSSLAGDDAIHNLPATLKNQSYYTGMVGKWHLMAPRSNDTNLNKRCLELDNASIPLDVELYKECRNLLLTKGFDFVNAWVYGNVPSHHPNFSHSPEWMVSQSQKFIDTAIDNDQPFFLYFASTLTHHPSALDALRNYTLDDSPLGNLSELIDEGRPDDTEMLARRRIFLNAREIVSNTTGLGRRQLDTVASNVWLDDSFGALITYLKDKDVYDDTFFVVINDHGMGYKDTLYEQGIRIINAIRYPPKFGTDGYKLPENFIVDTADFAAVIFNLIGIDLETDYPNYELDGIDWMPDVEEYLEDDGEGGYNSYNCCEYRMTDIWNSHAIVNERYKYIFRATGKHTDRGGFVSCYYPFVDDSEQLYDLKLDGAEQINLVDDEDYSDILKELQQIMIDYIKDEVCLCDDSDPSKCDMDDCEVPEISTSSNYKSNYKSQPSKDSDSDSDSDEDTDTGYGYQAAEANMGKDEDDLSDFYSKTLEHERKEEQLLEELSGRDPDTVHMTNMVLVFTYLMFGIICMGVGVFLGTKWRTSGMGYEAMVKIDEMEV